MILRNFLYLNDVALAGYVSAAEDGLRREIARESSSGRTAEIEGNIKVASARVGGNSGGVERTTGDDTPEARFNRLIELAEQQSEVFAWIDVVQPDVDLANAGYGAMVAGEADFYVPTMVRSLSSGSGSFLEALGLMEQFEPFAQSLGLDMEGMPTKDEQRAVASFVGAMKADLVAVGEFDESEWKIAGQLIKQHLRAEVEGPARFVGKLAKTWPSGEGRHLLALPGTTLLPRKERRELERKRPEDPTDDSFLLGPAVMLDLLAVWR